MRKIEIPKKSGGCRTIYVQDSVSCGIFRKIGIELARQCAELAPHGVIRGFCAGESPVTNAIAHSTAKFILNMDLADFFDHCTAKKIEAGLLPFGPEDWWAGNPEKIKENAKKLAESAIFDGAARQGLSSSPAAANCAAIPMDRDILAILPDNVTYTRYADDLTFSSDSADNLKELRGKILELAKKHGQEVKPSKTRMQAACAGRMTVTGVAVSAGGIYATKACRRKLRAARHNCRSIIHTIAFLCRIGLTGQAALFAHLKKREFSRMRGLEEWSKLKKPARI